MTKNASPKEGLVYVCITVGTIGVRASGVLGGRVEEIIRF